MKALTGIFKEDLAQFSDALVRYFKGGKAPEYTQELDPTFPDLRQKAEEGDELVSEAIGSADVVKEAAYSTHLALYRDGRHALAGRLQLKAFGARSTKHQMGALADGLAAHNGTEPYNG